MSHATGEVLRDGEVIGHFEYDGTSDVARRLVYAAKAAMVANWRQPQPTPCTCRTGVPVTLEADYGQGLRWDSEVCMDHGFIVGASSPYAEYDEW